MSAEVIDLTSEILWAGDIPTARAAMMRTLDAAGIKLFVYGNFRPGLDAPYYDTTYPAGWVQHYLTNRYQAIDPVVAEAHRSHLPFAWRYVAPRADEAQQRLFQEAAAYGICDGYSIPFHDGGSLIAVMSFAFGSAEELTAVMSRNPHLRMAGVHYHTAIERLLKIEPEETTLTAIERLCLQAAAAGHSLWDMSAAAHRPESDVAGALRTAREKLGASSTAQAVAMAQELGLIERV